MSKFSNFFYFRHHYCLFDFSLTLVYEEESCRIEVSGYEGFVNKTDIPQERIKTAIEHSLPLDCMWIVSAREGWKVIIYLFNKKKTDLCGVCAFFK